VLRQLDEQPSVRRSLEASGQSAGQELAPQNPPAAPQARAPVPESADVDILRSVVELARARREYYEAQLNLELKVVEGQLIVATESLQFARDKQDFIKQRTDSGHANPHDFGAAALEVRKAEVELEIARGRKELFAQQTRRLKIAELDLEQKRAELELKRAERAIASRRAQDDA
jgi:hypothetical protein